VDSPAKILVAEDDELTLELLATVLRQEHYQVVTATDGGEALDRLHAETFDLVLSDVQMTRASGLDILATVVKQQPDTPVVLITAYAEPAAAMDAIGGGAADYLAKPVDIAALRATVARALERRRLAKENRSLRAAVAGPKLMVGTCPAMLGLYKEIARVAPTDASVLITGESGAGKELVARTLHARSRRAGQPFVAVNCSALAEGVLESELFGHERGAFTGAGSSHRGLFETATGGTLFLDEIGDVPAKMQGELLRALQEGEIRRVGGTTVVKVDVRVLSATNRDIDAEVAAGRLRRDLAFRLNVVALRVPPLRERGDDIVTLTSHLAGRLAALLGRPEPHLSDEALRKIRDYAWPGNVRELENALARAVAMCQHGVILPGDLPPLGDGEPAPLGSLHGDWPTLAELERRYIERVLAHTGQNKTMAASILGVDRRTLQRLALREAKQRGDSEP
jgi:two-component system, NtrC family, response regulator AtoC